MEITQETNSNSAVWCHVITSSYRDAGKMFLMAKEVKADICKGSYAFLL